MKLVIVESPGKIKKIQSFLGPDYKVEASFGHIRDLDPKNLSIDIENNFKPKYIISKDKTNVVSKLKNLSNKSSQTILAADQDREGEAIAQSLKVVLGLKDPPRIVFTEITKNAILKALSKPIKIDKNQVEAQQTRRILDRIVGYQLSPLLWKFLPGTKSAGRVQSVLVRILVDLEDKIKSKEENKRIKMYGEFKIKTTKIKGTLYKDNEIKEFTSLEKPHKILKKITKDDKIYIYQIQISETERKPPPPFITSTLQQEASIRLHFPTKKTMMVAQKLYEKGYITYMRTDSTVLSKSALAMLKDYIIKNFSEKYYKFRNFTKNKKGSQEAHEAIRPTKMDIDSKKLTFDEKKLLDLITNRSLASQMSNAIIDNQKIKIKIDHHNWEKYYFYSSLNKIKFDGFLKVYYTKEESYDLLKLKENDILLLENILITEEFQEPPKRLNEAGFVNYLEKKGIGRPSTYSSLISKIIERQYIEIKDVPGVKRKVNFVNLDNNYKISNGEKNIVYGSEKKKLIPTEMGIKCNEFLLKYFENILEETFTANMEEQLDKIALGKLKWVNVLGDFYQNLKPRVDVLSSQIVVKKDDIDDLLGEINGNKIYYGKGKYGFYVKKLENGKWKFSNVELKPNLEQADKLLEYPKYLGKKGKTIIQINNGKYGYYIKYGKQNISIPKNIDISKIDLEESIKIVCGKGDSNVLRGFINKSRLILIKKGQYGNYIQLNLSEKKKNIKIPKKTNIDNNEEILDLIK